MANAKVSIVIPTKNEGHILENCLNSICNLVYPKDEIEVIIVDGGSRDATLDIAMMRFSMPGPRIAASAIASRIPGNASMISITLETR